MKVKYTILALCIINAKYNYSMGEQYHTALMHAANQGNSEIIETISNASALQSLKEAIKNNNIPATKDQLKNQKFLKFLKELELKNQSILFDAITANNPEIVKLLIESGADVDIKKKNDFFKQDITPLQYLMIKIKHRGSEDDINKNWFWNLFSSNKKEKIVFTDNDKEIIQLLLNNSRKAKELFELVKNKKIEEFKNLAKEIPLIIVDQDGNNLLHYAVAAKDKDIMGLILIIKPALLSQANNKGETPMELIATTWQDGLKYIKESTEETKK